MSTKGQTSTNGLDQDTTIDNPTTPIVGQTNTVQSSVENGLDQETVIDNPTMFTEDWTLTVNT